PRPYQNHICLDLKQNLISFVSASPLSPSPKSLKGPLHSDLGPYFWDGQRRIDYVLTYSVVKAPRARRVPSNSFIRSLRESLNRSFRHTRAVAPPEKDPEIDMQEQRLDHHEDDMHFQREEFEQKLADMGLELEREEGTKVPGVGFLKIHAPWSVLCREAEFMKLKMPTKKVCSLLPENNVLGASGVFYSKLQPELSLEDNRMHSEKHLSYPFSREKQHL
uniref:Anoctamin dimerisation domain-containing protein n=1 Tax=Electrophorus electricus TaxID=8005 RepID=A0AAY5E8W6_ELEEL